MTKVPEGETVPATYYSLDDFLKFFGLSQTEIDNLSDEIKERYVQMVNAGNKQVETALYKYNDQIPLDSDDEAFEYAEAMAREWALYLKASAESSPSKQDKLDSYNLNKEQLISVLQAQPQQTTIRKVTSSDFTQDEIRPYSQTFGVGDLL